MTTILGRTETAVRTPAESRNFFRACLELLTSKFIPVSKAEESPAPDDESEIEVKEILERLDGERLIFHGVPSRTGRIDHIVLSQAHGIFLIETKPHRGRVAVVDSKIRVNGRLTEKDFVAQTLRNTYWLIEEIRAATGLEASINPLIVFTHAEVQASRSLKGIPMTNRKTLLATMQAQQPPMDPKLWEAREQIAALLAHPTDPLVGVISESTAS